MDAATPFRRTLGLLAPLVVAAGCQSGGGSPAYRSQSPQNEPVPGGPVAPVLPVPQAPTAVPVSFTPPTVKAAAAALAGDPRIKVVAIVGLRNTITDQEVWEAARQRVQEYVNIVDGPKGQQTLVRDDAKAKEIYNDELKRIVERELVLDEMEAKLKKAGKAAVMDQIKEYAGSMADRRVQAFKNRSKAKSEDDFRAILAIQGLTPAVIRRQLERQVMADEYVRNSLRERGKTIGIGDVRRYYDEHPEEFTRPALAVWQHIFVSANRFPTPDAAREHAEKVRAEAARGADFVALCKQHDHGFAAMQKGEGTGNKKGEIRPAEAEPVVFSTANNTVGPLVETPTGYHIVKVVAREDARPLPYTEQVQDEIREKLMRKLQDAEYQRIVGELWQRGVVRFNPPS
ncbi:peptidyl-prolyl cis-trans isomerase [bacterium]|nr:peptidyl-prolyl cis-trans isomerase [bacterium]